MTTMGIIFANIYDSSLGELTNKRTMASLPYGGRYRQIDFSLSNMTNSAIRHIGIITKYNYQSLMNHIGSGQEWDLELGEGGLEFLTPFAMGHNGSYRGKLEALDSAMNFLKISTEEYVVLADSGVLCAINLEKIVEAHAASGADVTVVVKDGICNGQKQLDLAVKVDADDRVTDVAVDYCAGEQYLASMLQAKQMLSMGILTPKDYATIDTIMTEKYGISSCSLYRGIDLIYGEFRGNMSHYKEVTQCQEE